MWSGQNGWDEGESEFHTENLVYHISPRVIKVFSYLLLTCSILSFEQFCRKWNSVIFYIIVCKTWQSRVIFVPVTCPRATICAEVVKAPLEDHFHRGLGLSFDGFICHQIFSTASGSSKCLTEPLSVPSIYYLSNNQKYIFIAGKGKHCPEPRFLLLGLPANRQRQAK